MEESFFPRCKEKLPELDTCADVGMKVGQEERGSGFCKTGSAGGLVQRFNMSSKEMSYDQKQQTQPAQGPTARARAQRMSSKPLRRSLLPTY
ncbi:hypothetical protein SRHO_G00130540 [Serrasalmus rhombeus]